MAGENQFDQVGDVGGGTIPEEYNKEYVFFKDVLPIFLESDRSGSSGFTNTNRLKTLLLNWGFSDVIVDDVSVWKISGKNQYLSDGPRLEWKGNLYVKLLNLDMLKCKNTGNQEIA